MEAILEQEGMSFYFLTYCEMDIFKMLKRRIHTFSPLRLCPLLTFSTTITVHCQAKLIIVYAII